MYALSSRWSLTLSDADFFGGDSTKPIRITATLGDLDPDVRRLQTFGEYMRGYIPDRGVIDEPDDDAEEVLTVRLEVDESPRTSR